jgi:dienelactone hydrolase
MQRVACGKFAHPLLIIDRQLRRAGLGVLLVAVVVLFSAGGRSTAGNGYEYVEFAASHSGQSEQVLLRAQLFRPPGDGPFPGVILMHGCGGWLPAVQRALQSYARFLVESRFAVLNLDSFGPRKRSGGMVCESLPLLTDARKYRVYDAFDALRYMKALDYVDSDNVFLMGQSNGGSVAITAALAGDPRASGRTRAAFRAVVAYYPWCGDLAGRHVILVSPLLIFAGGQDDWTPPDECARTTASGATLQVKIYSQAAHSFDLDIVRQRYLGKLLGKNDYATRDSRERMLAFFRRHIAQVP